VTDATPKDATPATAAANAAVAASLRLDDPHDHDRAARGLVAPPASPQVVTAAGWPVWDLDAYAFLDGDAPPTVNPSLWRQAQLNRNAGLFEVADGIHQVRGLDLSNITVIEGDTGRIVIDPLTSAETARAAIDLVDSHLGHRRIHTVIYTHSHVDHFAGVRGIVTDAAVAAGDVQIVAPEGFLHAAVSENVIAGNVMQRRGTYMYGPLLPKGPHGHVDAGLGKGIPVLASQGLMAPTLDICETGEEHVFDGVRIVFQLTPDTEAPAEMNFLFPDHRALCMAENCTATLHNLYTPRGAQVRDALSWSRSIGEAIELFADDADVVFASHHWPRWGSIDLLGHLRAQRDTYRYIHDQTMRMANHGMTGTEIAEELELPPTLAREFASRDYYGTVNHNAKAVYQRYLGWFDGNPANLHPHPPVASGTRYVEAMGGADAVLDKAQAAFDEGDFRWAAQLLNHLVFAEPDHTAAKLLQADTFEQMGYQAESGPWRDFYLTGAQELRHGTPRAAGASGTMLSADTVAAMTSEMLLEYLGVRVNGPAAADLVVALDIEVTDRGERFEVGFEHGAIHTAARRDTMPTSVTIRTTHSVLGQFVTGAVPLDELVAAESFEVSGDVEALRALDAVLDRFDLWFDIVTP
jgi:alkyl sulfatase BDS1-like metallo-beta-lactamase superfamily hydrolase